MDGISTVSYTHLDGSFMIFLTHPFSVVLLLLTVAAVFSIARARLRRSKIAQLAQEG